MKTAKDYLLSERERLLKEAASISDAAAKENRSLAEGEREKVSGLLAEVREKDVKIAEIEDNDAIREQIEQMTGSITNEDIEAAQEAKSLGDAFVKSGVYQTLKEGFRSGKLSGKWTSGSVELPYFGRKATLTTATGGEAIQPDVQPGIQETMFRPLTVADLLASGTTGSNVVKYIRETTATNAADATAEGVDKPESAIEFGEVDEPVRKIATFLPVSDEMLEDVDQLRSYLDGRLRLFVAHAEESQLLNGDGNAPNLEGLLERSGIQTLAKPAAGNIHDSVYNAITNIRSNAFIEPDGIVMHPTDWQEVRLSKDSNEQYYGGGPMTGAYGTGGGLAPNNLWGLPVVVTSAIAEHTALVGAFGTQAQVFRRGGLTVEASNSHADFFRKNLTAIRAEERLALAVYRPAAFHTVTALDSEPSET